MNIANFPVTTASEVLLDKIPASQCLVVIGFKSFLHVIAKVFLIYSLISLSS